MTAPYSKNLADVLAVQQQILRLLQGATTESAQEPPAPVPDLVSFPGVILVADAPGYVLRDVLIDPRFVIRLAQDAIKGPTVGSQFDVTVITQAFVDGTGQRAQTDVVFGLPEAIAQRLARGVNKIPFVPPVAKIVARTAEQATTAIASALAAGGRFEATDMVDGAGDHWTLGPNGETLKNGVHHGGGLGSKYTVIEGNIYVLGTDQNWWAPSTDGWQMVTLPTATAG